MNKRKSKKKNPRRRKLRKNILSMKFHSLREAAVDAGYKPSGANMVAQDELKEMAKDIPALMARRGLTDEHLVDRLHDLVAATETKFAQSRGEFTDQREVVAWGVRKEGLDMAFKLRGLYNDPKKADDGGPATVNVNVINIAGTTPIVHREPAYKVQVAPKDDAPIEVIPEVAAVPVLDSPPETSSGADTEKSRHPSPAPAV